jgi:tRNA-2-methylthio-N6-dimethylallyladenosine synthase
MTDITAQKRYYIYTWGCQMNEEDSEQMGLYLSQMGYQATDDFTEADVILLNTCSVRQKPEQKVYSKLGELRELKQMRPELIICVCGCMAQVESVQIRRRAPFVDIIIGTGNLAAIPDMIRGVQARRARLNESASNGHSSRQSPLVSLELPERKGIVVTDVPLRNLNRKPKIRAHVPIMYGCDKFCTFCIVPYTRGRERSRPTAEILSEINGLARGGTREITLLGQTVNSYGKNLAEGRVPFARLLELISDIGGIERIRFTSPYPRDFTDDLIETMARLPKVCEHVHLPLQAADDDLLMRMHRGYSVQDYRQIVYKLREAIPGIAITTDIMLGFPGETEEQFQNTLHFVEEMRFDSAFMFAYSTRPGTKAAVMEDQVPHEVKVERLNQLVSLQNRIAAEINQQQAGQVFEALVDGRSDKNPDRLSGFTRTFKLMHFPGDESMIGKLVKVRALHGQLTGFVGEIVQPAYSHCV